MSTLLSATEASFHKTRTKRNGGRNLEERKKMLEDEECGCVGIDVAVSRLKHSPEQRSITVTLD